MKIRAAFGGIVAGIVSTIVSYSVLMSRATLAAMAIRRKMPNAWFSGLITWYAAFLVIGVSLVIAGMRSGWSINIPLSPAQEREISKQHALPAFAESSSLADD